MKNLSRLLTTAFILLSLIGCPDIGETPRERTEGLIEGSISRSGSTAAGTMVVVQNVASGESFQALVREDGTFEVPVNGYVARSRSLAGREITGGADSYIIALVDDNGRPLGTVVYGESGGDAVTGLNAGDGAVLDITVPADPLTEPITASGELDLNDSVLAAADEAGLPLGTASFGKDTELQPSGDAANMADLDGDGLVSLLDADDDGDGVADEFDEDTDAGATGRDSVKISFGFLLDLENEDVLDYYPKDELLPAQTTGAPAYFGPSTDEERLLIGLVRDMRVDIWIEPQESTVLSSARALETPAPAFMPELLTGPANNPYEWSTQPAEETTSYGIPKQDGENRKTSVFMPEGSESFFEVGDTFTFEITESGEDPYLVSKMLNFVFRKPFLFLGYGMDENSLTDYSPSYSGSNDITINPASDLILKIQPPEDETGSPLMAGAFLELSINYIDESGNQINDLDTTEANAYNWPTAPQTDGVDWEGRRWHEPVEDLDYISADENNAFLVTIPAAILKTAIRDSGGTDHNVGSWIIGAVFLVGEYGGWDNSQIQNRISCQPAP